MALLVQHRTVETMNVCADFAADLDSEALSWLES